MVTPLSWLERVPTYKEALEQVKDKDLHNYGFLGYPCLQTADIVIYSEEGTQLYVPVGEDQVSHVELSREIVRRLNLFFSGGLRESLTKDERKDAAQIILGPYLAGTLRDYDPRQIEVLMRSHAKSELGVETYNQLLRENPKYFYPPDLLTEPGVMLTKTPRIPGLDGRKMSKSYGNAITLSETDEEIRKKTKVMVTDPARKRRTDPGNPDVCPVYDWHKLFSSAETRAWAAEGCRTAGIGCIECKAAMAENLIKWIAPVRERRVKWENNQKGVLEMIDDGSQRARVEAKNTMERVREAVFHCKDRRREIAGDTA
jgi:tryptophanyl-tRNA synthetase